MWHWTRHHIDSPFLPQDLAGISEAIERWVRAKSNASDFLGTLTEACGSGEEPVDVLLCVLRSAMMCGPGDLSAWAAARAYSSLLVLPGSTAFGTLRDGRNALRLL